MLFCANLLWFDLESRKIPTCRTEKKAIHKENSVEEDWLVDTKRREITAYTLAGKRFGRGKVYTTRNIVPSRTLKGFTLRLNEVFVLDRATATPLHPTVSYQPE